MAKKKPKDRSAWRLIAESIARDLMTNGNGECAERIVMECRRGSDLGGRNFDSVATVIEGHLRAVIDIYEAGRSSRA